ncbi:hypothetical protein [Streptomyces sp. NPDC012616]|uniref:hypothetical protein n=1 Tax=Streptomyces sp. NPDC012616 TaxID=3364840 RepID=UPI0036ED4F56
MAKDVRLYLDEVLRLNGARTMGAVPGSVWDAFGEAEPGADFTRIYPFVAGD